MIVMEEHAKQPTTTEDESYAYKLLRVDMQQCDKTNLHSTQPSKLLGLRLVGSLNETGAHIRETIPHSIASQNNFLPGDLIIKVIVLN